MWCVIVVYTPSTKIAPDIYGPFPNKDRAFKYITELRNEFGDNGVTFMEISKFLVPECLEITVKVKF